MTGLKSSHVKVESMLTVVSSTAIEPGKFHKFTTMDNATAFHTLHAIFYYKSNPFNLNGKTSQEVLDNLRISLSELLCMYPPVTGRLTRDSTGNGNWLIKCNDAGVRMLRAKVGISLDEWLRFANADDELDLTVWEDLVDDPLIWSPWRIQINDFECGGLAIGISCPHMQADLTSVTQLIKSWTEVHRGLSVAYPPVFNLPTTSSSFQSSTQTRSSAEFYAKEAPSVKLSIATFKFSDSIIKKCLLQVHEICPDATPFDYLAALFWSRIVRLKEPKTDQNIFSLQICLDLRNNQIPYGYFGNAQYFSELSVNAGELVSNDGLSHVTRLLHQHVASIEEETWPSKVLFRSCKDENGKSEVPSGMYGPELTCVSMEQMINPQTNESLMYAAMFKKDEKPVHVSYHIGNVDGEGLVIVMPSHEGGLGRTVVVRLLDEHVAALHEDLAVLELEPVVIISGKKYS